MTGNTIRCDASRRFGDLRALYRAADSFDAAWQECLAGRAARPRIEEWLETDRDIAPELLLRELLAIELECRVRRGESPAADEYHQRLADDATVVHAVFAEFCGTELNRTTGNSGVPGNDEPTVTRVGDESEDGP